MEILEPHGRRFEAAVELLRDTSFTFDGVRFSLSSDGRLIIAIESSYWPLENVSEATALSDLRRAKSVADYLAAESPMFRATYEAHRHLFILVNYYGHGGEMEVARLVDEEVVWAKGVERTKYWEITFSSPLLLWASFCWVWRASSGPTS